MRVRTSASSVKALGQLGLHESPIGARDSLDTILLLAHYRFFDPSDLFSQLDQFDHFIGESVADLRRCFKSFQELTLILSHGNTPC